MFCVSPFPFPSPFSLETRLQFLKIPYPRREKDPFGRFLVAVSIYVLLFYYSVFRKQILIQQFSRFGCSILAVKVRCATVFQLVLGIVKLVYGRVFQVLLSAFTGVLVTEPRSPCLQVALALADSRASALERLRKFAENLPDLKGARRAFFERGSRQFVAH